MFSALLHAFQNKKPANIYEGVFLEIRLPRCFIVRYYRSHIISIRCFVAGLFRNPIVEPGLIGTSAGAAFGASIVFVFAMQMSEEIRSIAGPLACSAFCIWWRITGNISVYSIAKSQKKISVTSLLLVGIAINAIGLSGTGFMSYVARDPQARSITFWNLGTFSGATGRRFLLPLGVAISCFHYIASLFETIECINTRRRRSISSW